MVLLVSQVALRLTRKYPKISVSSLRGGTSMWQVRSVASPRWKRTSLVAVALLSVVAFGATACNSTPAAPPQPQTITDKGTPYGDLLVPKLTASVTDGAVGVPVDAPVTVAAEDGVLGLVTMTNADG